MSRKRRARPIVPRQARKPISLLESVSLGKPERVDREAGVIYHVKILGLDSSNGRSYSPGAIAKAMPFYEGRGVYIDHPPKDKAHETRSVKDRFGWFAEVKAEADGLYGNFHVLNPRTELAESLFNAAEKKPDLYAFSHNALGSGEQVNGEFVVSEITEVRSVDLVTEGATTKSLFEGRDAPVKKTVREILEAVSKALLKPQRKVVKDLLEMPDMDEPLEQEVDMPAEEPETGDQIHDAFKAMVCWVFDDDSLDEKAKIKKISEIIKSQSKLLGVDAEVDEAKGKGDDDADDDEAKGKGGLLSKPEAKGKGDGDDEDKDKDAMESVQRELATLKADKAVRVLLEDAGLTFSRARPAKHSSNRSSRSATRPARY